MLSISPDLGVSRLHAVDYSHRRHDNHRERDDRAEQEHHDRGAPGAQDQFLDEALARLTAEDTDRTEPEQESPRQPADREVLDRAAERGEEDHETRRRRAHLRRDIRRDACGVHAPRSTPGRLPVAGS